MFVKALKINYIEAINLMFTVITTENFIAAET